MSDVATIFCADCGTECALVDGRDVDAHDPAIADAWVWACPVCPASWAHQDKDGGCVGLPAGQATVNARALLRLQVMVPLVRQAPPNEQTLAAARVRAFLADHLDLADQDGLLAHLNLDQLRQAWRVLHATTYDDVRIWAQRHRGTKRRAQASGEGVAA
ncbi:MULTISPECIES: hypothetical protein [unclassified Methylobacterium]|uniref:hypothetical protein n=1 Tax=unclassified Methylobacterium TaxID=2615210 RepID=UPI0008E184EB|nr:MULTISPECIES: hypothetical protein [unclassified Methylobacterium]SFV11869.1 hypothetical protein SAMN02799643_05585 [Methylobacterium sp. UNCCL125]